jgi:hypothetical protein
MEAGTLEWFVVGGLLLAGLVGGIGIFLGRRDPETRPYLPSIAAEFQIGRVQSHPDPSHERERDDQHDNSGKDKKNDRPGSR